MTPFDYISCSSKRPFNSNAFPWCSKERVSAWGMRMNTHRPRSWRRPGVRGCCSNGQHVGRCQHMKIHMSPAHHGSIVIGPNLYWSNFITNRVSATFQDHAVTCLTKRSCTTLKPLLNVWISYYGSMGCWLCSFLNTTPHLSGSISIHMLRTLIPGTNIEASTAHLSLWCLYPFF